MVKERKFRAGTSHPLSLVPADSTDSLRLRATRRARASAAAVYNTALGEQDIERKIEKHLQATPRATQRRLRFAADCGRRARRTRARQLAVRTAAALVEQPIECKS